MKTVILGKDEAKWREGVFLGFIDSTTEYLIGTTMGITKCRCIRRKDATDQFDYNALLQMRGTPWMPVPTRDGMRIPTNIEESWEIIDEVGEIDGYVEESKILKQGFR